MVSSTIKLCYVLSCTIFCYSLVILCLAERSLLLVLHADFGTSTISEAIVREPIFIDIFYHAHFI